MMVTNKKTGRFVTPALFSQIQSGKEQDIYGGMKMTKMTMRNKTGRFVTGLIVGSLTGAAAGLLFAPRSGRETRDVVRHKTGHYVGALRERFGRCGANNGAGEHAHTHVGVAT